MKKRALLSVFDKTGIENFAHELVGLGFEIISTGGTLTKLKDAGIAVTSVSDITGFPECLDGRVKTLHPAVHAGILAMRENPEHMEQLKNLDIRPIDVVAINLYPFKQTIMREDVTLELAIENIDIGGPTMLRAAAKNWQDLFVVVDPSDYTEVIKNIGNTDTTRDLRFSLAVKVFGHTAAYDSMIAEYLLLQSGGSHFPQKLSLTFEKVQDMRYGENPHQNAAFYSEIRPTDGSIVKAKQLWGKELSYNNINDANGALMLLKEFSADTPTAVAVKHANPCGVAFGDTIFDAYCNAYAADPISIFGGIVALNRPVDLNTANELAKTFLEVVIAPSFEEDALEALKQKKNLRLLELPNCALPCVGAVEKRYVLGGLLVQDLDTQLYNKNELKVVTKRAPTDDEMRQLIHAFAVVKHTKSNGIVLFSGNKTVGIGPGQTNRITALYLAVSYAGDNTRGCVLASDAFFPFSDCVEAAHEAGITAIIQPGGSIKDDDSIALCDKYNIAMVFTGQRHFKH